MMTKFPFSYRLFVWFLLVMAILMGGGYLVIAFTYNLQKETEKDIELAAQSVLITKDLEIELVGLRNFTFIYIADKSPIWLDSLMFRKQRFIVHLEKARGSINTPEETMLVQQISALFANYEQNINQVKILVKEGETRKANALLVHSGKDLLATIHDKSMQYIALNKNAGDKHRSSIEKTNSIVFRVMIALGIAGVLAGLFVGWMISRMLFNPISQLILTVKGASGETVVEKLKIPSGNEISELGTSIQELIDRVNRTQDDLKKNKLLLQYSNKYAALGKVAPTIAHEIRNPLTSIKMLIYSMKDESSIPDTIKQDFEIISHEIDRMEEFIKNFLKFSKPADPVFKTVNINELLGEIIHLLRPQIRKSEIVLNINIFKIEKHVSADSGQLKQLFMNLILNAIEVLNSGGTLVISTSVEKKVHDPYKKLEIEYVCITIDDNGPGIPEKVLKSMFEPFVKGTDQGVGLGLSISQNIASMHNGWIEGENKTSEQGAIFKVFIPTVS